MQRTFKVSRWLHKYIGLVLIVFLAWMSLSGVLMNHPDLISRWSVPGSLVPDQYHIRNWNRSAIVSMVHSEKTPDLVYAAGKQGIWKSVDGGRTFEPTMQGLPDSRFYRKTNHLWMRQIADGYEGLFASTNNGLFLLDGSTERWNRVALGDEPAVVRKLVPVGGRVVAFTESEAYAADLSARNLQFSPIIVERAAEERRVSLVRLFFDLHDGHVWGLPGVLLYDAVGLVLFFLSISAFYSWYYPWKRRRQQGRPLSRYTRPLRRLFKWFFKYHLKLGIWTAAILLIIGGTGFFMRPPLLAVIAEGSIPAGYYPGVLPDNAWDKKIQNALYDERSERILIQATDGIWAGPADFSKPFEQIEFEIPIFVMGATVFEEAPDGQFLVGSFNGLFKGTGAVGHTIDRLTGAPPVDISSVRPADKMITAHFRMPDGTEFINTHEQGILPLDARGDGYFRMPAQLTENYRMPLWNYLFEIHNGRFFREWIGGIYILIVPLGSLLFVLITLSGVYDWVYLKVGRRRSLGEAVREKSQKRKA